MLFPPAPFPQPVPTSARTRTESDLRQSQSEDSGLGLEWVYVNADIGAGYAALGALGQSNLGLSKTSAAGLVWGAGAGARFLFMTVGARMRNYQLANFTLWTVGGEAAWHAKLGRWDPTVGLRASYGFLGSVDSSALSSATVASQKDFRLRGLNLELTGGADYYFNSYISVGAELGLGFWFMGRPQLTPPSGGSATDVLYTTSGSATGLSVAGTAHVGVHF
jgi:hypothetical protein